MKLVAQWEASGDSAAVFARQIGVSAATVWRWKHELSKSGLAGPTLAKIVEVRPAGMTADDRFDVRLAGGRCVGVPASFDEAALGRLLRVLEVAR
jgi:transposase-like protein